MNLIVKNIPNSITCMNIAAGCVAVICAFKGSQFMWGLTGFDWCAIFIGIAAVMDFLDGMFARLLGAYSELGKELDSLCDGVSFGVAPAMMIFNLLKENAAQEWLCWLAIVIPIAGVLRLAKFNIDTRQTTSFIGLPIPANAIFWIGFCFFCKNYGIESLEWYVVLPLILFESWLMVSPIHLFSLKFKNLKWKGNIMRWLLIVSAVVLVAWLKVSGLMWLIAVYVVMGMLSGKNDAKSN